MSPPLRRLFAGAALARGRHGAILGPWQRPSSFLSTATCSTRATALSVIVPHLEAQRDSPHTTGFLYMMIHEQYYHPDYQAYIPTYCAGIERAVRWAVEEGYRSAWLEDVVLE